jgi:hypothetical protein
MNPIKNNQNITLVVLVICAAVLTAMLAATYLSTGPREARAGTAPARAGEYIAVVGRYSSSMSLLYVTDLLSGKMNAYAINHNDGELELIDGIELERVFRAAE